MIGVLIKREHLETDTQRECHMKMKAEIWVQVEDSQQPPAARGKARDGLFLTASEDNNPDNILILDVEPPEL